MRCCHQLPRYSYPRPGCCHPRTRDRSSCCSDPCIDHCCIGAVGRSRHRSAVLRRSAGRHRRHPGDGGSSAEAPPTWGACAAAGAAGCSCRIDRRGHRQLSTGARQRCAACSLHYDKFQRRSDMAVLPVRVQISSIRARLRASSSAHDVIGCMRTTRCFAGPQTSFTWVDASLQAARTMTGEPSKATTLLRRAPRPLQPMSTPTALRPQQLPQGRPCPAGPAGPALGPGRPEPRWSMAGAAV